jgi:hypothetical protein
MKHYSSKLAVFLLCIAVSVSAQGPASKESLEQEYGVPLTMVEKRAIVDRILLLQAEIVVLTTLVETMHKHIGKLQAATNCS